MTKEIATKKIKKTIETIEGLKGESQEVKNYIIDVIYLTFQSLEIDCARDDNGKQYTQSANLSLALEINLTDDFDSLLKEARRETKKDDN